MRVLLQKAGSGLLVLMSVALISVAMTACGATMTATSSSPTATSTSTPQETGSSNTGLVAAIHPRCDTGKKVLHYLATGDNGGDSQLDVLLAKYVGVPLPQARAIADQQIQQCDTNLSKQETAQASAAAASQAAASAAATMNQQRAAVQAEQQRSCAKIGGRVDTEWGWCASTVQGNPSGNPGADCKNANVAFNSDGTIADYAYTTDKDTYPHCFL